VPDLVGQYYRSTSEAEARRPERGQLCWGPGLYLPARLATLHLTHYDPRDERRNRYSLSSNTPPNQLFNHTPIHELRLEHDEELLVIKAKRRLMVVMSQSPKAWPPGGARLRERGYVCLPLYSFHRNDSPAIRSRIQALEYPWWIYLPDDATLGIREGFARLDRMQVVEERLLQPRTIALTDEALWFVSEWVRYYLTEEIEPLFLEDRQERMNQLP
jgi:hypothetical protein